MSCLQETLSPQDGLRTAAETQLEQRSYPHRDPHGEFGVLLARVFADPHVPLPSRQAAGIALKKYVYERWSLYFESFLRRAKAAGEADGAESVPEAAKGAVREILLRALGDEQRKVRLLASQLLSIIGSCDFPDHFPELLPTLSKYLSAYGTSTGAALDSVHGAMKFLSEFVRVELDENQLLMVASDFVPLLQALLAETHGPVTPHIKARCVLVFRQCLTSLYMAKDTYTATVEKAIDHYLPPWLHAMQALLDPAYYATADWEHDQTWEVLGLRREILRTLGVASRFKKRFAEHGTAVLQACLANLEQLAPLFERVELRDELGMPAPAEGDVDVAASVSDVSQAAFTLLSDTLPSSAMRALLVDGGAGGNGQATTACRALLEQMRWYAQVTAEDEAVWESDADAFVAEDDEENVAATLRTSAIDLTEQLLDLFPLPVLRVLREQLDALAAAPRTSGTWWKPIEAQLLLLGASHESVEDVLTTREDASLLSLERVFEQLVLPFLDPTPVTYLRGRCFVFSSQFAGALPVELGQRIFKAAEAVLHAPEAEAPLHLKLSAVRTISNFAQKQPSSTGGDVASLLAFLSPLLTQARGSTLILLLDGVEAAVPRREAPGAASLEALGHVAEAALATWLQHTSEPPVELSVAALLERLLECPVDGCAAQTVSLAVPYVTSHLGDEESSGVPPSAAALLRSVVDAAPAAALDGMVPAVFSPCVACLVVSDDTEVVQSLVQVLTTLLQRRAADVLSWHDEHGTRAVPALLHVVEQVLLKDEALCGMPLGTLLVTLFVQVGADLDPVMPALLDALVKKLVSASTPECQLALLFPLAYLVAEHTDAVVAQLSAVPLGDASALVAMVRVWLAEVAHVHSWFVLNVHVLGLARLLSHWPAQLDTLLVDGPVLPAPDDGT